MGTRVPLEEDDHQTDQSWSRSLAELTTLVRRDADPASLGDAVARAAARLPDVDRAAVMLVDGPGQRLRLVGAHGLTSRYIDRVEREHLLEVSATTSTDVLDGPALEVFRGGRLVQVADTDEDPTFVPWRAIAADEGFRSILAVPLDSDPTPVGVLTCYGDEPRLPPRPQRELIDVLAKHAGALFRIVEARDANVTALDSLRHEQDLMTTRRRCHDELVGLLAERAPLERLLATLSAAADCRVEYADGPPAQRSGATVPVTLRGDVVGHLRAPHGLDPEARELVEATQALIALHHAHQTDVYYAESRHLQDVVHYLLNFSEAVDDEHDFLLRVRNFGHDLARPHRLVLLRPDVYRSGVSRRIALLARTLTPPSSPDVLASYRGDTAVVVVPSTRAYEGFAHRLHHAAQSEAVPVTFSTMQGPPCTSLSDFQDDYLVTRAALVLRQEAGSTGSFASIEGQGTLQFLLQSPPQQLIDFSRELLRPIKDHGAAHGAADLLRTLRAFFRHGMTVNATAHALSVHPNTISNRLARIAAMTGLSTRNVDDLIDLRLAMLVDEVLRR